MTEIIDAINICQIYVYDEVRLCLTLVMLVFLRNIQKVLISQRASYVSKQNKNTYLHSLLLIAKKLDVP